MGWKYESLVTEARDRAEDKEMHDWSREELIEHIAKLEAQLKPFWIALKPCLDKSWRGTTATSDLFPIKHEDDVQVLVNHKELGVEYVNFSEDNFDQYSYLCHEESITIEDGSKWADDKKIISFHQQAPACYISNGSVFFGDVRRLDKLFREEILNDVGEKNSDDKRT